MISVFQLSSKNYLEFENNYSVCDNTIFERTEKKYIPSLWWELQVFAKGYIRVWTSNYSHVGIMEEECSCWRTSRDVSCRREMLISRLPGTRSQQPSVPIPRTKCSSAHISGETMHFSRALRQRLTGTRVWSELYPEQDVNLVPGVWLPLMLQKTQSWDSSENLAVPRLHLTSNDMTYKEYGGLIIISESGR